MKIYTVTESHLDYDDYPVGRGKVILTTTCEALARLESDSDKSQWKIAPELARARIGRTMATIEVPEEDPEVLAEAEERYAKIKAEREAWLAAYDLKQAERKAAVEEAKRVALAEKLVDAPWFGLPQGPT